MVILHLLANFRIQFIIKRTDTLLSTDIFPKREKFRNKTYDFNPILNFIFSSSRGDVRRTEGCSDN